MKSFYEASARERIDNLLDPDSFKEFLPPQLLVMSPHLSILNAPVSFDDGVVIGSGLLDKKKVYIASQEGKFMGGGVGEVHGAKITGLLRKAILNKVDGVILLLDTGGVRLHEANAGLIAVSEVMRAVLDVREAQIPVISLIGSSNGCYGGMGIVACCTNRIIMSEEGRLSMSGPEVIETANGVEEFDSRDKALVWRTMGGKNRYLLGDSHQLVDDEITAFRKAASLAIDEIRTKGAKLTLEELEKENKLLKMRVKEFGSAKDPIDIWKKMGLEKAEEIPLLETEPFLKIATQKGRS